MKVFDGRFVWSNKPLLKVGDKIRIQKELPTDLDGMYGIRETYSFTNAMNDTLGCEVTISSVEEEPVAYSAWDTIEYRVEGKKSVYYEHWMFDFTDYFIKETAKEIRKILD